MAIPPHYSPCLLSARMVRTLGAVSLRDGGDSMKTKDHFQIYLDGTSKVMLEMFKHQTGSPMPKDVKVSLRDFIGDNRTIVVDKIEDLYKIVRDDIDKASFGIPTKTMTQIQKSVFNISYVHSQTEMCAWLLEQVNYKLKTK